MKWEGASLSVDIDGESYSVDLSNTQFVAIAKLLGLQFQSHPTKLPGIYQNTVICYSDKTVRQLMEMKGNPLRLGKEDS